MSDTHDLYAHLEAGTPWVLLVDDDPNILDTAKDILEEARYVIYTAGNGAEAIAQLDQKHFNIVVVDFQLPDSTGLELARKVRERDEHTLVILMTGHASLEMAVKAIQEAVYDYLIKPVDPAQLQRAIEKALEKQRLVLENRQLLNDLQAANTAMSRLDTLKSKMLAVMSHDLRTPLSSIRGYSEVLKSGMKGRLTDDQKRILEITIQEADHINGLIGDLLDLASVDAGKLNLETRPVTLDEIVKKVSARIRLTSEMKEIPLDLAISDPAVVLQVDVARVIQVLSNILRSCFKHTARGGHVFMSTAQKGALLEVRMTHTGHGFTPEQLKNLFGWTKTSSLENGSADGLRIGLAIAREIILAHGGQIGAESQGVDQGSTFWLTLPVMQSHETVK